MREQKNDGVPLEPWEVESQEKRAAREKRAAEVAEHRRKLAVTMRKVRDMDGGAELLDYIKNRICEFDACGFITNERADCFWQGRRFVWGELSKLMNEK